MRLLIALFLSQGLFFWGTEAAAYQRIRNSFGIPIFWSETTLPYYIGKAGSRDIGDGSELEAIQEAARRWSSVACSALRLEFKGFLDEPKAIFLPNAANQNVIYWVEPPEIWPFPQDTLALTSLQYKATGEIEDADIQLNGHLFRWSTTTPPQEERHDVLNTVVHEIGHLLGLDHSLHPDATMYAEAPLGEVQKRDLANDDIEGLCSIYGRTPEDRLRFEIVTLEDGRGACPPPRPQYTAPPPKQGCDAPQEPSFSSLWFALVVVCLFWRRRGWVKS